MNQETKTLLTEAVSEIRALRQRNALMSARLEMFDTITAMLNTEVARKQCGSSPDVTYAIEKHIEQMSIHSDPAKVPQLEKKGE